MKYQTVILIALMFSMVLSGSSEEVTLCEIVLAKTCSDVGCSQVDSALGCAVVKLRCAFLAIQLCKDKRRKRDLVEKTLRKDQHLIPLPALFEAYDLNGDGKISVQELALTAGIDKRQTQKVAFPLCDKDGDGFLSRLEFASSPLLVEQIEDIELEREEMAAELQKASTSEKPPKANDELAAGE